VLKIGVPKINPKLSEARGKRKEERKERKEKGEKLKKSV